MQYSLGLYEKALPDGFSFREMLSACREGGFDRLEISIDESEARQRRLLWTEAERRSIRAAIEAEGIGVTTMCLSGHRGAPLGSHDAGVRARAMEIMAQAIALSQDIGVRLIQLAGYDVYYEKGDGDTRKWFLENLQRSVELAASTGVLLGFETMETPFMDTVGKAMAYVEQIDSPYLGIYPDIGNLKNASLVHHHNLIGDIRSGAGHIYAAHLKETKPGVYRNMNFGEGHTEYLPCIRELLKQGVRMFTGEFWYLGAPDYKKTLKDASAFLRARIGEAAREDEADA